MIIKLDNEQVQIRNFYVGKFGENIGIFQLRTQVNIDSSDLYEQYIIKLCTP